MELQSISYISKKFNISARTLRYYEQIGIINSEKKKESVYRFYSEDMMKRIQKIILLRKLRIPLKQIADILEDDNVNTAIDIFNQNLNEVNDELYALQTLKNILERFIERLNQSLSIELNLFDDTKLVEIVDFLTISKIHFKEEKMMDELNKAREKLNKLADRDVRIVYLPPATVATIHLIGGYNPEEENKELCFYPEEKTFELMREFIKDVNLEVIKPDFRHYGFNHPNGSNQGGPAEDHGYERWVTIPDHLEVREPFKKDYFKGGLYAAHAITIGAFEEWNWLWNWVNESGQFTFNLGATECMDGLLEEHLNTYNHYKLQQFDERKIQLDLLIPIKEKLQ